MFKRNSSRCVVIVLALFAPVMAMAGDNDRVSLNCPAGTALRRGQDGNAWFCAKTDPKFQERSAHGPYVSFYQNGQKQAEGQHSNGDRAGLWTFFDEKGTKTEQIEFKGNNYHGRRVQYYNSGKIKLEEQWVNGKREGIATSYSEDGKKLAEFDYRAGHLVKEQRFENGKPVASK